MSALDAAAGATPMLELRQIDVRFADGTEALRNVSLVIARGEFCVLLGSSGAGKSTLLRVINALARPTSGTVLLRGRELQPQRRQRPIVATIHQGIELAPRLSVLENVLCGSLGQISTARALLGLFGADRRRRACHLLHRVGLSEHHLYRRASELSGGQQQRVGIARAFMATPSVVLADEPVASLDPRTSREILTLLQEAAREHGATVLCSLHDVDLAMEFSDRIVGLRDGRVAFDCTPQALSSRLLGDLYGAAA